MIETKEIHSMWQYREDHPELDLPPLTTKYVYHFRTSKGKISMIKFPDMFELEGDKKYYWEIYSEEVIFSDVERFDTEAEARRKVREYLE